MLRTTEGFLNMPETSLTIEPVSLIFAALRLSVNIGADYLTGGFHAKSQSRKDARFRNVQLLQIRQNLPAPQRHWYYSSSADFHRVSESFISCEESPGDEHHVRPPLLLIKSEAA
jgi:hypothetical protein